MTTVTPSDKLKLMARLGGLPPGTRMIEYTTTYTKTYTNRYYKLIDDQHWVAVSNEAQDDHINTHKLIDHVYDHGDHTITAEQIEYNDRSPEASALYYYLCNQDQEYYDSYEESESFDSVGLEDRAVKYDPNNTDHQRCVNDYIQEIAQKYGAQQ